MNARFCLRDGASEEAEGNVFSVPLGNFERDGSSLPLHGYLLKDLRRSKSDCEWLSDPCGRGVLQVYIGCRNGGKEKEHYQGRPKAK
ncbi:hypothetical protein MASR1M66_20390 [Aminivibrio sp.]